MCKSTGHLLVQLVYYDQRTNGGICEVQFETRPTTTRRLYTRDGRRGEQEQTAFSPLQRHVSFQWETFCRSLPDRKNKISRLCLMRCTTSDRSIEQGATFTGVVECHSIECSRAAPQSNLDKQTDQNATVLHVDLSIKIY